MNISENLKNLFEDKKLENITASNIAKKLNISKSTLSNYINGDANIPLEHLNQIANLFNVSVDYFFGFTKNTNYKNNINIEELNATEIGKRLKEFRKVNNLTLDELAKSIGVNKSTLSRYENGKNIILTITLYTICKKYHVSADYLLGRTHNIKII